MEGIRKSIKKAFPDERLERLREKDKATKKRRGNSEKLPRPSSGPCASAIVE